MTTATTQDAVIDSFIAKNSALSAAETTKIKSFFTWLASHSSITPPLMIAIIEQSGGWELFTENSGYVSKYGISGGYDGWIYYSQTMKFFEANRRAIINYLKELGDALNDSYLVYIAENILKDYEITVDEVAEVIFDHHSAQIDNHELVTNKIAWLVASDAFNTYQDFLPQ